MTSDFRGASADAVATLVGELETVVSGSPDTATQVGRDLFSVAGTLRAEGGLRRFVTDASVAAEARQGVVEQLVADKVGERSLGLLRSAVSRRWTAPRDLADALEHLSVVSLVRAAGGDAERVSDELFAFAQAVKENPSLRDALSDPARSDEDKARLVDDLLGSRALPATTSLVKQALASSHRTVAVALVDYQKVAAEARDQGIATVRVARELPDAERARLTDALARQYGRPVHLNVVVDLAVIGGLRVEIGDDVIDGTISSRLDDARRRLVG